MELNFDRFYQITDDSRVAHSLQLAASLLKDFITTGVTLALGMVEGHWFWRLTLPGSMSTLPSTVSALTTGTASDKERIVSKFSGGWILHNRPFSRETGTKPFNRTMTGVLDFPLESLFALTSNDFTVRIELPSKVELMPGAKDSAMKLRIWSTDESVANRLGQWLDARSVPFDARNPDAQSCFVGLSELHYLVRVPIHSDTFLPQLQTVPADVVAYIQQQPDVLRRGLLLAGLPGSGKTTTLKAILSAVLASTELSSLLIADVKGEYQSWAQQECVRYLSPGQHPVSLQTLGINLFIPPSNLRLVSYINALAVLLAIGGFGGGGVLLPSYMNILLEEYYSALLLHRIEADDWPTDHISRRLLLLNLTGQELFERLGGDMSCFDFANRGLLGFWHNHSAVFIARVFGTAGRSNSKAEIEDVIASRLAAFETSILQFFCYENGQSVDCLLTEKWCLGLNGFSKGNMQLLMSTFFLLCFESLLAGQEKTHLEHLFIIEEAHLVAAQTANSDEIFTVEKLIGETIERALCEARSKGVGIVLTDQQPGTKLLSSVLANTNMKVCHNILGRDGELMAKAMGLSPDTNFSSLGVGEAYVKLGDSLPPVRSRIRL